MKKMVILVGLFFVSSYFLPCAMAAPTGELVIINTTDPISMDPQVEWMGDGMIMMRQMYDQLIDFDENGKFRYRLALSYKLLDDKTWQLKLRPRVKFHNGDPFTAADAKFTIDRILDPKTKWPHRGRYDTFEQVNVVDDYTLEIKTKVPDPLVINKLAAINCGARIVPKRYIEEKGVDYFREHPVGTGPFKFVKWVPKGETVMEANGQWWGGPPKLKRLVFRSVPEMASRVSELEAGGAHIITAVPAFMVSQLEKSKDIEVQSVTSVRNIFFYINTLTKGPLQDKRVRQALNYAVDIEATIKGILKGRAIQTPVNVPPIVFGYDGTIKPYPYDPEKAKTLLKEAGYEKGFKLTVNSPSGRYPNDKEVAEAVSEMLRKVGIDANLLIQESGTYFKKVPQHELEGIALVGLGYLNWDVDSMLNFLNPKHPYCHYHNPEMVKLVKETYEAMDLEKRKTLASKLQKMSHEEAVHLFLYNQMDSYGVSKKVKGFKARADDVMDLYDVSL
jgi:peptide/nickel transport system substrate-binding protein